MKGTDTDTKAGPKLRDAPRPPNPKKPLRCRGTHSGTDSITARREKGSDKQQSGSKERLHIKPFQPTDPIHSHKDCLFPISNLCPGVQIKPKGGPRLPQLREGSRSSLTIRAASGPVPAPARLPSPHSHVHRHQAFPSSLPRAIADQGHLPGCTRASCSGPCRSPGLASTPSPADQRQREKAETQAKGQGPRPSWTDTEAIRRGPPQSMDLLGHGWGQRWGLRSKSPLLPEDS